MLVVDLREHIKKFHKSSLIHLVINHIKTHMIIHMIFSIFC